MVPTGVMRYRTSSSHHLPSWRSAGSLLLMVTARLIRNSPLTATSYVFTGCSCDLPSSVRLRVSTIVPASFFLTDLGQFFPASRSDAATDSIGFKRPSILRGRFLTASRSDAFQDSGGCGKLCAKFQSCVAKRRSQGLERICATFHSLWEVLDCVAKRRISGLGRMWQALREVPERAASGPRLKAP